MRPPNEAGTSSIHLVVVRVPNRLSGDKHQVPARLDCILPQSHGFPQLALNTIPHNSISDPATDRETKAAIGEVIRQDAEDKQVIWV
jgi:hypothetical protein